MHASLVTRSARLLLSLSLCHFEARVEVIIEAVELIIFVDGTKSAGSWVWDIALNLFVVSLGFSQAWDLDFDNEWRHAQGQPIIFVTF